MRTIREYLETVSSHVKEGRNWSPVSHEDLVAWEEEMTRLKKEIQEFKSWVARKREEIKAIRMALVKP